MHNLDLIVQRQGDMHRVTASNGRPIHADVINLASEDSRLKFALKVEQLVPGIPAGEVAAELLRLAVEDAQKSAKPSPAGAITPINSSFDGVLSQIPHTPFPIRALPSALRRFASAMAKAMGLPVEVFVLPMLGVCASAIGNSCRCWINPSWTEPSILWLILLMESGELKTPAFKAAMKPTNKMQMQAERDYRERMATYEAEFMKYEQTVTTWKRGKGVDEPPVKPTQPTPTDYFTSNTTIEAVVMMQQANPRGILMARDEASGWLASFGQYKGGKGDDEATWLEMYTCGTIKNNRCAKRAYVRYASCSLIGTCQPAVFSRLIRGREKDHFDNHVDNGLLARCLVAKPIIGPKTWHPGSMPVGVEDEYCEIVLRLMQIPLAVDLEGHPCPKDIPLTVEAQARFAKFVNEHGKEKAQIEDTSLRYHYAKLEGVAARFALVIQLCRWAAGEAGFEAVDTISMEGGIELANWFKMQAHLVYGQFSENASQRLQRELVEYIRRAGGSMTPRELARANSRYREPGAAEQALGNLIQQGLGTWESDDNTGGRPATRFTLAAAGDSDGTPGNLENTGDMALSPGEYMGEPGEILLTDDQDCSAGNPDETDQLPAPGGEA